MKPFDLEAAKRGDKFCAASTTGIPLATYLTFVGVTSDGRITYETIQGNVYAIEQKYLQMVPKTVWKVKTPTIIDQSDIPSTGYFVRFFDLESRAKIYAHNNRDSIITEVDESEAEILR